MRDLFVLRAWSSLLQLWNAFIVTHSRMFWGLSVHRGCNCLYNSLTDDLRVVSALWFIIMQPTCFCSVSGTSRFSSALKLEKFLWFSITVCQPWGLQEYSEGGKVRWVLNGWVLVWTHMRNWGGIHIPFKAAKAAQWRRNRSDFGRYNFLAANEYS